MSQKLIPQCGAGKNSEILESYIKFREANNKSKNTIKGDIYTLSKLLNFTNNKPLKEIDESDLQGFMKTLNSLGTKSQYGMKLITFYRWFYKITFKHQRPPNMEWFEFPSEELKAKHRNPDIKRFLITPTEYNKIIQFCRAKPKWSALYETLYLSGGRPNEVNEMNIGDVINEGGKVTVLLNNSKTIPSNFMISSFVRFGYFSFGFTLRVDSSFCKIITFLFGSIITSDLACQSSPLKRT